MKRRRSIEIPGGSLAGLVRQQGPGAGLPAVPRDIDERIDGLELALCEHPGAIDLPVEHRFTPGLYSRTLRAPAGILATTYIHRQEHQFVLSEGEVSVFADRDEVKAQRLRAPFFGITLAGTRRVVFVHRAAVWTTFHPTNATTVEEVERELFEFRILPDGSNVRDRFRLALAAKAIEQGDEARRLTA